MPAPTPRRLRAPTADGAALIDPPREEIQKLLAGNRALFSTRNCDCQGQSLINLSRQARQRLLVGAMNHTRRYRDLRHSPWFSSDPLAVRTGNEPDWFQDIVSVREVNAGASFILAGHQPDLFHAGVWYKCFLLSELAKWFGAVPINLIIDTDTVRNTSIRVPIKSGKQLTIENVAFDSGGDVVPFEERSICDPWLFDSFGERVLTAFNTARNKVNQRSQPIIKPLWMSAAAAVGRSKDRPKLGLVLAEARHQFESLIGLNTLEIPLSAVARSSEFRWFAVHLLAQLPRLWRVHNTALAEHRRANHIRSDTHPVPSLQEHDDWLEAPFFLWTTADPRRRPLFVRNGTSSLTLSDRHSLELSLDVSPQGSADTAVEQLASAESRGIKLRPRALITTMYARLVLSDLFIHGIGGAKYDELTDLIIRRFFGIEPPAYVTATATFRLPIDRPSISLDDVRASAQRIRELRYRPESFRRDPLVTQDADLATKLAALAAERRAFLDQHDLRRCSQDVFDRLNLLNLAMNDLLTSVEREMRAQHAALVAQAKQSQLLASREFSFVLFPSEILPARLLDLSKQIS